MRLALALVLFACSPPARTPAVQAPPPATTPLVIGESFRIDSRVLGEPRVINVYLPPDYGDGKQRYPVLYALDGGMKEDFPHVTGHIDVSIKNALIRPVIVVGVENTVRRRDLAPATAIPDEQQAAPLAGGTEKFRRFLRDELKPAIAARYRVTAESALVGESLAGLFAIETLLVEPALFDHYIAVDPSVWWNDQATVRTAAAAFARWTAPPRTLFVATAEMQPGITVLLDAVRDASPAGLAVHHEAMPAQKHGTIFPFAALIAFRRVFAAPAQ